MTEYGDRINQLDLNVSKTFKFGWFNIQPKIDFFNVLNVAAVTSVLGSGTTTGMSYGSASYNVPSVVLNPRTFQIGALVRF